MEYGDMRWEWNRLATFDDFPFSDCVSTLQLAQSGYYYTKINACCRCYSCGHEHSEWRNGRIPNHCELGNPGSSENIPMHHPQPGQDKLVPSAQPATSTYSNSVPGEPAIPLESVNAHHGSSNLNHWNRNNLFDWLRIPTDGSITSSQLPSVDNVPGNSTHDLGVRLRIKQTAKESSATNSIEREPRHLLPRGPSVVQTSYEDNPPTNKSKVPELSDQATGAVAMCPSGSRRPVTRSDPWLAMPEENLRLSTVVRSTPGIPQTYRERLSTFHDWPSSRPTAQRMAVAGLFYLGNGDCVQCSFCGGRIRNWSAVDEPWAKHAQMFPHCEFIQKRSTQISGNRGHVAPDDIDVTDEQIEGMPAATELRDLSFELPDIVNAYREIDTLDLRCVTRIDVLKYFYEDTEEERFSADDRCVCCVCLTNVVSVMFFPCRHGCCTECKCRQVLHHCPRCDHKIRAKINVFMS